MMSDIASPNDSDLRIVLAEACFSQCGQVCRMRLLSQYGRQGMGKQQQKPPNISRNWLQERFSRFRRLTEELQTKKIL